MHPDHKKLEGLFEAVAEYQSLASKHGVSDIFQDNGGKLIQVVLRLGLSVLPGRLGHDAADSSGNPYELKSLNLSLTGSFSTHHHLNESILRKYREPHWIFATYLNIELQAVWVTTPEMLEPLFRSWQGKLCGGDLNNPKIPLSLVETQGVRLYDVRYGYLRYPTLREARILLAEGSKGKSLREQVEASLIPSGRNKSFGKPNLEVMADWFEPDRTN